MEITLIRHGKSKHIENNRITSTEFQDWIKKYNGSGVIDELHYPSETVEKINTAKMIITSNLKRSIESAKLVNPKIKTHSDRLFRETELPNFTKRLRLKLRPNSWAVILRSLWLIGYSRKCESLAEAKKRAKLASEKLIQFAQENTKVVLIGHGFFNQLISKELIRKGWKGKRKTSTKHWTCTTYSI
ncbi:phosphoglycerate mutase family protein [Rummeliibacillus pycnus]|uniref:phosphoglycerate mutase family protein n=1 Tax=Rummeliibacillus pycnus TaxID=101070 RepID=UPI000C9B1066|nr:histidine phosphatase family protein [Rummeliibacillus pycnus]